MLQFSGVCLGERENTHTPMCTSVFVRTLICVIPLPTLILSMNPQMVSEVVRTSKHVPTLLAKC